MTDLMLEKTVRVAGGVDTHLDVHVVAALDQLGRVLGTASFEATACGSSRWTARTDRPGG